jgi:hypothetical protein
MTGLYNGVGAAIALSLFLLFYVPMISLLLLNQIGLYGKLGSIGLRILWQVLTFMLLVTITLLVLRSAPYVAVDWVFFFGIAVTMTYLVFKLIRTRQI